MRVLINTLSVGSLSGQHVVYGFMSQITRWCRGEHEFLFLHYESSPPPESVRGDNTSTVPVDDKLAHWFRRSVWEMAHLPKLVRRNAIDLVLCPSGGVLPTLRVPQVVLAQNPWCFIRSVHHGSGQRSKAWFQRRAYRRAFQSAALMVYISEYLRSLYRDDAGRIREAPSQIAHVALDQSTHDSARRMRAAVPKQNNLILSVSAMARWKGASTLVKALKGVRDAGVDATLRLVGPWPDASYETEVRHTIAQLGLQPHVTITGQVSRDELHRHYAQARVFSLMSQCESFGIPAAEAQAFGTPVVVSRNCAMPEVCGRGGVYGDAGDVAWASEALRRMLTDNDYWQTYSQAAIDNSQRFQWQDCAKPLMSMFSLA
jgi:glycosyltransferase involved in cell wall biosynthesis